MTRRACGTQVLRAKQRGRGGASDAARGGQGGKRRSAAAGDGRRPAASTRPREGGHGAHAGRKTGGGRAGNKRTSALTAPPSSRE